MFEGVLGDGRVNEGFVGRVDFGGILGDVVACDKPASGLEMDLNDHPHRPVVEKEILSDPGEVSEGLIEDSAMPPFHRVLPTEVLQDRIAVAGSVLRIRMNIQNI